MGGALGGEATAGNDRQEMGEGSTGTVRGI